MNNPEPGTLVKLSEIDETIAGRDDDIRGRTVKDVDGEDLGTVKDLLVDEAEKRVRFLEVASGGFLGIGQDTSLIPVDAISAITDDEVKIAQSRETVAGAPAYDPDLVREPDVYSGYLGYYGYGSWWTAGYQYPAFPYYR